MHPLQTPATPMAPAAAAFSSTAAAPLSPEIEGQVRALQIQSMLRQTPAAMMANLVSAAAMCLLFREHPLIVPLLLWFVLVVIAASLGVRAWLRSRQRQAMRRHASPRAIRLATRHACLLATLWALPPLLLASAATAEQKMVLVAVSAGMICTGGFALCTIRAAGTAFPSIVSAGCALALLRADLSLGLPLALLLAMCLVIVVFNVRSASETFRARIVAELQAEHQHQVIGLLLRDFEKHSADTLWETDASGALQHVSERFAGTLGYAPDALEGMPLPQLIKRLQLALEAPLAESGAAALERLATALGTMRPFRDLELPLRPHDRTLWWSLSAKPLAGIDGTGGWRGVVSDVTVAREAQRRVWELALFDVVTGLPNRHHFREELESTLTGLRTGGGTCAILIVDLDGFKNINDTLGHDMGDRVLKILGQRLSHMKRRRDLVARLGGDEFGLILREIEGRDDTAHVAERVRKALRRPCDIDGVSVPVVGCIGIALAPADSEEAETLIKHADLALYAAKAAGPGQVRFYAEDMAVKVMQRVALERALGEAISGAQLRLMFQPQLRLASGKLRGFEALARWHHPELGEVSPALFIPIAEEAGMIAELGSWVLKEACRQASTWPEGISVAVNLSPLQVMTQDLRAEVVQALATTGLPADRLELEITESVLLTDSDMILAKLHSLRDLGLRIALDDFGTGYSAMAYLRRFPFDKLKIDRAFVQEIAAHPDGRAIVHAIIDMAHALRMETVAEGVEQTSELDILRTQGCDEVQGYLVSRPLPADEVARFIASWERRASDAHAHHLDFET